MHPSLPWQLQRLRQLTFKKHHQALISDKCFETVSPVLDQPHDSCFLAPSQVTISVTITIASGTDNVMPDLC